jgi:predicted O-methyltransferase YrrM
MDVRFPNIAIVAEYLQMSQRFSQIEGFLHNLEGYALFALAATGDGEGEIVEIGSFMGRSTCWLAAGAKKASRERITAIDHFRGSPEHQIGQLYENRTLVSEGTTFHKFMENIEKMQVSDYVNPVVATSEEAASNWNKTIRLLFIDGDHSYSNTKRDFKLWSPFVCDHGYICFHDVGAWPGPTRFYDELRRSAKKLKELMEVGTLRVAQKTK